MKTLVFVYGLLLVGCYHSFVTEANKAMKTFKRSDELFANPERGWIAHRESNDMYGLDKLRDDEEKVSLVLIKIDLSKYVTAKSIGQEKLDEIKKALDQCVKYGLKAILRSAYAWKEGPPSDPQNITIIINHIKNMKDIYFDYEHVIIAVEMGMFGLWGELHTSKHSIKNESGSTIKIDALKLAHDAYMIALPKTRSVLVRRPYYIRQIFKDDQPLQSYDFTPKARTGYHNDAYLSDETDMGTFDHGWNRTRELEYINQMSRYTFFGGETCGTPHGKYNSAKNVIRESKIQHMTYLNRDYDQNITQTWGNRVRDDLTRYLGYRFQLKTLSYSKSVRPVGKLHFHLTLENIGFSSMHLKRSVYLILDNGKKNREHIRHPIKLNIDPRSWTPESGTIHIRRHIRIPRNINQSIWQLFLALPDPSKTFNNDPRYAVRFANINVWNNNGLNLLADDIHITKSALNSRS